MGEKRVWSGTPSQAVNMGSFIVLGLFFWLVIPLLIILYKWYATKKIKYELTTQRLKIESGIFNKNFEEIELYRVKDYSVSQPFFLRLFGVGNVLLETSDRTHPLFTVMAIKQSDRLKNTIRTNVEKCRAAKGVREFD